MGQAVVMLALFYDLVDDYLERRTALRADHLALAEAARDRGELLLAGAMSDPYDQALLVWSTDEVGVVESFAKTDPYVVNGLVKSWRVRTWNVVIGDPPT
jgi:uncharacterized protein